MSNNDSGTSVLVWTPTIQLLGTVKELQVFSFGITCYTQTNEMMTYHNVVIEPQEQNPQTIIIVDNTKNASISGHYGPHFNDTIRIMRADYSNEDFDTLNSEPRGVSVWDKLNTKDYSELIGFNPDPVRHKTFHYIAKAFNAVGVVGLKNTGTPISTKSYTINLSDQNWEPGKIKLKEALNK